MPLGVDTTMELLKAYIEDNLMGRYVDRSIVDMTHAIARSEINGDGLVELLDIRFHRTSCVNP